MKILCYSDAHGILPDTSTWPKTDLAIFAGDMCPNASNSWSEDGPYQINWLLDKFNPWIKTVPAPIKIIIGGNHCGFHLVPNFLEILGWLPGNVDMMFSYTIYLENSGCTVYGRKIWGVPHTNVPTWFRRQGWSFGCYNDRDESKMGEIVGQIPLDTEILITHGPAYGLMDIVPDGEHTGSKTLANKIKLMSNLKLHCHGHIHANPGKVRIVDEYSNKTKLTIVNAAQNLTLVEID